MVKELSSYEADLEWGELNDVDEIEGVAAQLGQAVAKIHSVADEHADTTLGDATAVACCAGVAVSEPGQR